ncbi:MAG: hypothetical protein KKB34_15045 [Bacteroidetes bacterium]|nr:hypothetical protein [Bacteroidota bacterium]
MKNTTLKYDKYIKKFCDEYNFVTILKTENVFTSHDTFGSFLYYIRKAFPKVKSKDLERLNLSSNLLYTSILAVDNILDEALYSQKEAMFMATLLRDESLKILNSYFEPTSLFWNYFQKYQKEYIAAILLEDRNHFSKNSSYSIEEMEKIAAGKAAIAKVYPAGLAILSDLQHLIVHFEKSLDYFFTAVQLFDDLRDWRSDFKSKKFSYMLSKLIEDKKLKDRLDTVTIEEIGRMVFFTNLAENITNLIISYYEKAIKEVECIECNEWRVMIKIGISECSDFRRKLLETKEREIEKVSKKSFVK